MDGTVFGGWLMASPIGTPDEAAFQGSLPATSTSQDDPTLRRLIRERFLARDRDAAVTTTEPKSAPAT